MAVREALRGLRFMLRRGGETLSETLSVEVLPPPASELASAVLQEVNALARSVDEIASGVAKTILGGQESPSAPLQDLVKQPEAFATFGAALYVALSSVLKRLGAETVFVSEAAARNVLSTQSQGVHDEPVTKYSARLTLALHDARVMRGTTAKQAASVPGSALEPVALFAVMLWIQSDRSEAENEAVLNAATDMSIALASEIAGAFGTRDLDKIEALYARCVPHV